MEIPSKAAKTRGLKGILYFKTVKDGIVSQISIFCYLNLPSKAGGIAVALFQYPQKADIHKYLWCLRQ